MFTLNENVDSSVLIKKIVDAIVSNNENNVKLRLKSLLTVLNLISLGDLKFDVLMGKLCLTEYLTNPNFYFKSFFILSVGCSLIPPYEFHVY
jgi:hypothetical protein